VPAVAHPSAAARRWPVTVIQVIGSPAGPR
jgi:hypothetical protein